jgi:DNA-directed RNA polymerase I, II, and III subunit RPABC2
MPPKKEITKPKVSKTKDTKKSKNVKFSKEENINTMAPLKENLPATNELDLDEDELEKEKEIETEIEVETEVDKDQEDDQEDQEEDHEVDDEVEYDDIEIDNLDDIYDDEEGVKPKKSKVVKKKKDDDDEDDESKLDDDICEYDYSEIYDEKKEEPSVLVENSQRITLPKLTKYERVRIIGTRSKQISLGAKVMIKNTTGLNPIEIAKLELEHKMIPMKIKRVLPDNKIEIWKLSELDIDN